MDVHTSIPLKNYLTMRLGGNARFMTVATTTEDVVAICNNAATQDLPIFVLGGGSNTLVADNGFPGIIIRNQIRGIDVLSDEPDATIIRFGAGENWDDCVSYCVERNLSGVEALSAIPGTIGAAPVQNIGAYGQELADTFVELEAYDTKEHIVRALVSDECEFAYRHSIFRGTEAGRYIILSVTLRLSKQAPAAPFYSALETYFSEHNITLFTPQIVREAVMAIRFEKLPDPTEKPNSGSFFKNAVVEKWQYDELSAQYPSMPAYDLGDKTYKIPTGWLIEQTGLKGQLIHGMRIHDKNALVLINESASSFEDLQHARNEIITKVRDLFRVTIEQEPLEIA